MAEKSHESGLSSNQAWINGRETWADSPDYGEVVVPAINVWGRPGSLPRRGHVVGKLPHGTKVNVAGRTRDEKNGGYYYQTSGNGIEGWVGETFLSWKWSCFTFLGILKPAEPCTNLEKSLGFRGMNLLLKENGYAVVAEGNPSDFDSMQTAASRFVNRLLVALVPITAATLQAEPTGWVEVPMDSEGEARTVEFTTLQESTWAVTNEDVEAAYAMISLMASVPYLDLALSDYFHAIVHPQHAPILLARSTESIENHFSNIAKQGKGAGKEQVMREWHRIARSDVEYITKRAKASHRCHATREGRTIPPSKDELAECFQRAARIIVAFVDFLEASGF